MREWLGPIAKYVLYAVFAATVLHQALASQRETRHLLSEQRRIRTEIAQLRRANVEREQMRQALLTDPFYVERMLRERYGYRAPGDVPRASPQTVTDRSRAALRAALANSGRSPRRLPRRTVTLRSPGIY